MRYSASFLETVLQTGRSCCTHESNVAHMNQMVIFFITDVPTLQAEDCNCLEPCNSKSHKLEVTYASLATSSIKTFLDNDINELRHKYHRALELKYVSLFRMTPRSGIYMLCKIGSL